MFLEEKSIGEKKPATAPVIGLADFIEWLKTKDPNERYNFHDCNGACATGQYFKARGIPWPGTDDLYYSIAGKVQDGTQIAVRLPWTFGALLKRAQKVLRDGRL